MSDLAFGWQVGRDIKYDRRVDDAFVELFERGHGLFRDLSEFARRARYSVDLQFRRDIRSGRQHATVYVGPQKALDLHWNGREVKLTGHSRLLRRYGWEDRWATWMPPAVLHEYSNR